MRNTEERMLDRRWIIWDADDGPIRYEGDKIVSDGRIGRVRGDNATISAYARYYPQDGRSTYRSLAVGEFIDAKFPFEEHMYRVYRAQ